MGNLSDKDYGELRCGSHFDSEGNFDTIDRDFKYEGFSRASRCFPQNSPNVKVRKSSWRKSIGRSPSGRRRASFKAKQSVRNRLVPQNSSVKSVERKSSSVALIADMEVKVDGKVAKLVLRNSVLRRRAQATKARPTSSPVESRKVLKAKSAVSPLRSPREKKPRHNVPKDSLKIHSAEQLRQSSLEKRASCEAATSPGSIPVNPVTEERLSAKPVANELSSQRLHATPTANQLPSKYFYPSNTRLNHLSDFDDTHTYRDDAVDNYTNNNNNNTKIEFTKPTRVAESRYISRLSTNTSDNITSRLNTNTPDNITSRLSSNTSDNITSRLSTNTPDNITSRLGKLVVSPITDV